MSISAPLPDRVHLMCRTCGRRGSYSRERYIKLTGTDQGVLALEVFARKVAKCERALEIDPRVDERCGLVHDLEAEGRPYRPPETQRTGPKP